MQWMSRTDSQFWGRGFVFELQHIGAAAEVDAERKCDNMS